MPTRYTQKDAHVVYEIDTTEVILKSNCLKKKAQTLRRYVWKNVSVVEGYYWTSDPHRTTRLTSKTFAANNLFESISHCFWLVGIPSQSLVVLCTHVCQIGTWHRAYYMHAAFLFFHLFHFIHQCQGVDIQCSPLTLKITSSLIKNQHVFVYLVLYQASHLCWSSYLQQILATFDTAVPFWLLIDMSKHIKQWFPKLTVLFLCWWGSL